MADAETDAVLDEKIGPDYDRIEKHLRSDAAQLLKDTKHALAHKYSVTQHTLADKVNAAEKHLSDYCDHQTHLIDDTLLDTQATLATIHQAKYWIKTQKMAARDQKKDELARRGRKFSARTLQMQEMMKGMDA